MPLITVYMPTWNREDLAIRAIKSVIAQDYQHWELIVIDDCSPGYEKISNYLNEIQDSRIIFIRNEFNSGACAVRNQAIKMATGYLITGIDDDDTWLPNRLSSFLEKQHRLYQHAFLYADDYICDKKDYTDLSELNIYPKPPFEKNVFDKKNIIGNQMFTLTRRLKDVLFDTKLLAAQDYDAFYRLTEKFGTPLKIDKVTQVLFVNHGEARITGSRKKFAGYWGFYKKHKWNFDKSSKKYQLFTLYYIRNKPMGLRTFLILMTLRNMKRYFMLFTNFKKRKF
ncbi:colanic acid biosynthesis glycosyltransferase WcaA [Kosakonia sp. H02]|nr:colanic acid biosynthesis glycosyltransferase WcaA [Kosakonia sp. H02]